MFHLSPHTHLHPARYLDIYEEIRMDNDFLSFFKHALPKIQSQARIA
jgi:hypothetical protein